MRGRHQFVSARASSPCYSCKNDPDSRDGCPTCRGTGWRPRISLQVPTVTGGVTTAMDISGCRWGSLVAVAVASKSPKNENVWRCKCDCGRFADIRVSHLTAGRRICCATCSEDWSNLPDNLWD